MNLVLISRSLASNASPIAADWSDCVEFISPRNFRYISNCVCVINKFVANHCTNFASSREDSGKSSPAPRSRPPPRSSRARVGATRWRRSNWDSPLESHAGVQQTPGRDRADRDIEVHAAGWTSTESAIELGWCQTWPLHELAATGPECMLDAHLATQMHGKSLEHTLDSSLEKNIRAKQYRPHTLREPPTVEQRAGYRTAHSVLGLLACRTAASASSEPTHSVRRMNEAREKERSHWWFNKLDRPSSTPTLCAAITAALRASGIAADTRLLAHSPLGSVCTVNSCISFSVFGSGVCVRFAKQRNSKKIRFFLAKWCPFESRTPIPVLPVPTSVLSGDHSSHHGSSRVSSHLK